ncbi:hypothetical protein Tco_1554446 [Tanacetum coccineum]
MFQKAYSYRFTSLALQQELLVSKPTTLGEAFSLARVTEARLEDQWPTSAIAKTHDIITVVQTNNPTPSQVTAISSNSGNPYFLPTLTESTTNTNITPLAIKWISPKECQERLNQSHMKRGTLRYGNAKRIAILGDLKRDRTAFGYERSGTRNAADLAFPFSLHMAEEDDNPGREIPADPTCYLENKLTGPSLQEAFDKPESMFGCPECYPLHNFVGNRGLQRDAIPMVANRKFTVLRTCLQIDQGTWVIAELSHVTWVEHMEVDEPLPNRSGFAFGAERMVAWLERSCERWSHMNATCHIKDPEGKGVKVKGSPTYLSFPTCETPAGQVNLPTEALYEGQPLIVSSAGLRRQSTPVWRFFCFPERLSSTGLGAELAEKGLIFMRQSISPNVPMLSTKSLIALVLIFVVIAIKAFVGIGYLEMFPESLTLLTLPENVPESAPRFDDDFPSIPEAPEITSGSESECETREPLPPLPKLIGA